MSVTTDNTQKSHSYLDVGFPSLFFGEIKLTILLNTKWCKLSIFWNKYRKQRWFFKLGEWKCYTAPKVQSLVRMVASLANFVKYSKPPLIQPNVQTYLKTAHIWSWVQFGIDWWFNLVDWIKAVCSFPRRKYWNFYSQPSRSPRLSCADDWNV